MTRQDKKFPLLFVFIDGIVTALIVCTGKISEVENKFGINLAIRVSIGALITGGFVFFVAKYAELRGALAQAEKELCLTSSGKLVTTALGKKIIRASIGDAILCGVSIFVGTFFILLIAVVDFYPPWITFVASIVTLGISGVYFRKSNRKSSFNVVHYIYFWWNNNYLHRG